ncbi:ATP-binding SpoIIE family protein phosphatase [Streptacidiphilus neutrinimicus]|uniref:ATP-binding SpoIIE family protein phosphatase n=1 Tax=Streptacidiphilus neutrinimicus TaxID=105420 RepID=UPI0005A7362A|nr:SpoIIE family protein phosphatase [Streptacidiphilus neutrinimicus]
MHEHGRPGAPGRDEASLTDAALTEVLESVFQGTPNGLAVYDTELRLVRVNAALERILDAPAAQVLGRRADELFADAEAEHLIASAEGERIATRLRTVLHTGTPVLTTEHRARTAADPDHDHVWAVTSFRLTAADGRILGVASAVVDVTERDHARERLLALREAADRIGSTLDVTRTAEELTEVAVPRLADFVAVDLLEGVERGAPAPLGPVSGTAVLRRAAHRSVTDDAPEASVPVGTVMSYHPATPYARCLASGQPLLLPVLDRAADWLAQDPLRAAKILAAGTHSLITVPLKARTVTLGLAHFYRWRLPGPFDQEDLALARDLVGRAAVSIDNARRYTEEHRAALTLQRSLLLRGNVPDPSPLETAHRYLPAEAHAGVGGDWFDVIPLSGARVALVVGDVTGRGIHAVARAGRLRTAIRTLATMDLPPDELLWRLDALVHRQIDTPTAIRTPEEPETPGISGTCLCLVYDRVTGRASVASAGHPPPIVVRPDGSARPVDLVPGPPLGLAMLPFEATDLELADGSVLALWTDGLVKERRPKPGLDVPRLLAGLTAHARSLDELCQSAVDATLTSRDPGDDAVLVLVRTRILPPDRVATWDLSADPAEVSRARAETSRQLASWGLDEAAPLTELIVSELVTNALRHGREPFRLRLIRDGSLICEVSDSSSTSPHLRHAGDTDEGGRGLFLVAQLADNWGTRYVARGKTIWAEQSVPED